MLLLGAACGDDDGNPRPDAATPGADAAPMADAAQADAMPGQRTYTNPLKIEIPGTDSFVQNCPDPSIIRGQKEGDDYWYLYCTSNPLTDTDRNEDGVFNYHLITIHRSKDLVNWTYVTDAFEAQPEWAAAPQGFWAPDIQYFNDKYYLYYSSSNTKPTEDNPDGGAAIGVATSDSPIGPWTHADAPVVEPQKAPCCPSPDPRMRVVIDSFVVTADDGQRYIYYGSYFGGIAVRALSPDGLHSDPISQQEVVSDERYEGAYIVKRDNYYYLFGSATNCCNGPLTGYSVFAGRSESPTGPFVDREGVPFTPGRVGGTPVISMNGNRWVGPGHNSIFTDFAGQDWIVYHAIDRNDPYRGGTPTESFPEKRPVLMDPLDWVDGWPTVRGGHWASDTPQPAPAAQPGDEALYQPQIKPMDQIGAAIAELSDEFEGETLDAKWSWVREADAVFGFEDGQLRFNVQRGDLYKDTNRASVLTMPVPEGKDYVVETKVKLDVPAEGCCFNYTQAGLVIYGGDDSFIKLVHFSLWDTRQIEFAKEVPPENLPQGFPTYGNTVAGPPGETTWLRIVARVQGVTEQTYTAYTSLDGETWYRNGTWTHNLGDSAKIGLVSMAQEVPPPTDPPAPELPTFVAHFDYVHVYELAP